jgi:hypothetical protein
MTASARPGNDGMRAASLSNESLHGRSGWLSETDPSLVQNSTPAPHLGPARLATNTMVMGQVTKVFTKLSNNTTVLGQNTMVKINSSDLFISTFRTSTPHSSYPHIWSMFSTTMDMLENKCLTPVILLSIATTVGEYYNVISHPVPVPPMSPLMVGLIGSQYLVLLALPNTPILSFASGRKYHETELTVVFNTMPNRTGP